MIFGSNTEGVRVFIHISRFLQLLIMRETFVSEDAGLELVVVFDAMDEHRVFAVWSADDVGCDGTAEALFETALVLLVLVSVVTVSVDGLLNNGGFVERHVVVVLATQEFGVAVAELVATFETMETACDLVFRDKHSGHSIHCTLPVSVLLEVVLEGFAMP